MTSFSTVHNIIKRFRESEEISICEGENQYWMAVISPSDGTSLKTESCSGHQCSSSLQPHRVLWSDEAKFNLLYGNNGSWVLWAKEERDQTSCCQCGVKKPASVMVQGFTSAHGIINLRVNSEHHAQLLEQHVLISATKCPKHILHVTTGSSVQA